MKMTLLEIVQDVLNDIDGDEIDSYNDTVESLQIAKMAKSVYYELMTRYDWPHLHRVITLTGLADTNTPNYLQLPVGVYEIENMEIRYDVIKDGETRKRMTPIPYVNPQEFIRRANELDNTLSTVTVVTDIDGTTYNVINDKAPSYWTTFDDEHIVFNSYDSAVDTSYMLGNKSQAFAIVEPSWTESDSFTPDLPSKAFPLYVEELKSTASFKLRQVIDDKSEQKSKIQQRRQTQVRGRAKGGVSYPDYGRRGKKAQNRKWYFDKT